MDILYTPSSGRIDITIFEERRGVSVPLLLHFEYKPSMGSAPIHEIADSRNERIWAQRLLSRQKLWRCSAQLSGIRVRA